jgi:tetratricopeptide (TPR) repeat protein
MRKLYLFIWILLLSANLRAQTQQIQLANQYYTQGDIDKALRIYESLVRQERNIPMIHQKYLTILLDLQEYSKALKYVERTIRRFPDNTNYAIDKGLIYMAMGRQGEADAYFRRLIEELSKDNFKSRRAVQYMLVRQLTDYAVLTLTTTRYHSGNPMIFALDLANIYRTQNKKDLMVLEYLNFANQNPRNLQYVKNTLQTLLTEQEDLESLELLLYDKVQQFPDNDIYGEMLVWVNLQLQNFYGAFIQARAIDKRLQLGGSKVLSIGMIALNNKDYTTAIRIFDYIVTAYPDSYVNIQAQLYKINARENLVKNTYPVNVEEVAKLIGEYDEFIETFGDNRSTQQAKLNKALLYAYYRDDKEVAIEILLKLVSSPRIQDNLKARAKLELADIYLLHEEPWESALLYAQVDKAMKESPLGYEAKLRNAKLAYYRGDFNLAQEYLDILKLATSREIANDAMELSIFISSNTVLDTSTSAMQSYARIELLLFQNKDREALEAIAGMRARFEEHSLADDLLYLEANLARKSGNFTVAAELLQNIVEYYGTGILAPKAYFELGVLYQEHLHNDGKASEIYEDFLKRFPGSIYTVEARKRFRILRGDLNYVEGNEGLLN